MPRRHSALSGRSRSFEASACPQRLPPRPASEQLFGNLELVIAVLLGIVSIATAYASLHVARYDSRMAGARTNGSMQPASAESLYLEANEQFLQDTRVLNHLTELRVEQGTSDPEFFSSPFDDADCQDFPFSGYARKQAESVATDRPGRRRFRGQFAQHERHRPDAPAVRAEGHGRGRSCRGGRAVFCPTVREAARFLTGLPRPRKIGAYA